MNRVCLNVLVGIPGAGKTTFCQRIKEYLIAKESCLNSIHICFDDFIKFDAEIDLENTSFKSKRKRLLELLEQIIQVIKSKNLPQLEQVNNLLYDEFHHKITVNLAKTPSNYLILVDDNMYYRSMRFQVFQIARRLGTGYFQTFLDVSLDTARTRNSERSASVPEEVIARMFYKLEKPNERICRWERNSLILSNPSVELEIVLDTAMTCLENPVEPIETHKSKEPVEQSLVHKVDLLLRKTVGEMVKQQRESQIRGEIKLFAEGLLSRRKQLLEDLRAGLVEIDPELVSGEKIRTLLN
uniref:L-seryl-tRNA(Sec) kinase n=1 Tax=Culex tarsalis TaxID=7177 RepID=A0A1Q3FY61_CULTA